MSEVRVHVSVSADGCVAGPKQSLENPLGEDGEDLHDWVVALTAWREPHGLAGGEVNASTAPGARRRRPLFEGVGPELELKQVRAIDAPSVTHVEYRVAR